jgi:hypothetical protein
MSCYCDRCGASDATRTQLTLGIVLLIALLCPACYQSLIDAGYQVPLHSIMDHMLGYDEEV